jgi:hypothetical protein
VICTYTEQLVAWALRRLVGKVPKGAPADSQMETA